MSGAPQGRPGGAGVTGPSPRANAHEPDRGDGRGDDGRPVRDEVGPDGRARADRTVRAGGGPAPDAGTAPDRLVQGTARADPDEHGPAHDSSQNPDRTDPGGTTGLRVRQLTMRYPHGEPVIEGLDVRITPGAFTVVLGPNACGKSTLLRALSRVLAPSGGRVLLDGRDVHAYSPKALARRVGFLAQSSLAPDGITVRELVARGRYPHQGLLRPWSVEDEKQVRIAMERTHVAPLAHRPVANLSGGQRQRVWIAMTLAQQTDILLLDEPTTYLDLAHQVDVLDLCRELNRGLGTTIVAVLHDLNQACRYADEVIVMHDGAILAHGAPSGVVTPELVERAYGLAVSVFPDPITGTPLVLPRAPGDG